MRTTFTGRQIFELERMFETKKYLNSGERSHLSRCLIQFHNLHYLLLVLCSLSFAPHLPFCHSPLFRVVFISVICSQLPSYYLCSPLQAPGGVRAASEDLVPEPSNKVEEAGERRRTTQDGRRQHPFEQDGTRQYPL